MTEKALGQAVGKPEEIKGKSALGPWPKARPYFYCLKIGGSSKYCLVMMFIYFENLHVQILFFIVVLGGVHCGIYKSSYNVSNISYLNSPPPLLSFFPSPPFLE
jgi:hypothetical protein